MIDYPDLKRYKVELDKCVTCGICHAVCPSYLLSNRELLSPRGRIVLLRRLLDGDISPGEIGTDTFDFCTLCYACQTACPAGVKTDMLFIAARNTLAKSHGIDKTKQRVFDALENPKRVRMYVTIGAVAQKVLGSKAVESLAGGRALPSLRTRPLLNELPPVISPEGPGRLKVAFFVGCVSNYVSAGAARASIEVLRQLGVEVIIPRQQVCCGAPAFNNGEFDTARRLAKINLKLIMDADVDYLVSPDETCGGAFRHEIPQLLEEEDEYDTAVEVSRKTTDWVSLVLDKVNPTFPETTDRPIEITIHDSCHLAHTQHTQHKVRELIERLPGVKIVEMKESGYCCGFGGSFSTGYPDEAREWTERKLNNILEAGVQVTVVSSPGCIQQLERGMKDKHIHHLKILHPAELIAERCGWRHDK